MQRRDVVRCVVTCSLITAASHHSINITFVELLGEYDGNGLPQPRAQQKTTILTAGRVVDAKENEEKKKNNRDEQQSESAAEVAFAYSAKNFIRGNLSRRCARRALKVVFECFLLWVVG